MGKWHEISLTMDKMKVLWLLSIVGVCLGQFGGPAMQPEVNDNSGAIPVLYLQVIIQFSPKYQF